MECTQGLYPHSSRPHFPPLHSSTALPSLQGTYCYAKGSAWSTHQASGSRKKLVSIRILELRKLRPKRLSDLPKNKQSVRSPTHDAGLGASFPEATHPSSAQPTDPRPLRPLKSGTACLLLSLRFSPRSPPCPQPGGQTSAQKRQILVRQREGTFIVEFLPRAEYHAMRSIYLCEPQHDPITRMSGLRTERLSNLYYIAQLINGRLGLPIPRDGLLSFCGFPVPPPTNSNVLPLGKCLYHPLDGQERVSRVAGAATVFINFLPQWACSPSHSLQSCHAVY